jgi:cytoskeleton protein RodZ
MLSFGEKLKLERESRNTTLEEIAGTTKIQLSYLEALEHNEFEALPGRAFGKFYIRAYAEVLGFDPQPLIADYDRERLSRKRKESPKARPPAPRRVRRVRFSVARPEESVEAESAAPVEVAPAEPVEVESPETAEAQALEPVAAAPVEVAPAEPVEVESPEPAEVQASEPVEAESAVPAEVEPAEPSDLESAESDEVQKVKPVEAESADLAEVESTDSAGIERLEPAEVQPLESVEVVVAGPANVETPESFACEPAELAGVQPLESAEAWPAAGVLAGSGFDAPHATHGSRRTAVTAALLLVAILTVTTVVYFAFFRTGVTEDQPRTLPGDISAETSGVPASPSPPPDPDSRQAPPAEARTSTAPLESAAGATTTSSHLSVPEFGVGTRVVDRRLQGRGDRFDEGRVVMFATRVLGGKPGEHVRHVWLHEGKPVQSVELELGGPHWRTHSRKTLRGVGRWAVEARDSGGRVLARATFTCVSAGS